MKDSKVVIIGSYNVGLSMKGARFPEVGETFTADQFFEGLGGKGSNQVIAASVFGANTSFVGCIGNDKYGKDALAAYLNYGISTQYVKIESSIHTGMAFILIDQQGRNMIEIASGANLKLTSGDIDRAEQEIKNAAVVGFQLEGDIELVDYGIRKVHSMGIPTLLDPAPAVPLKEDLYPLIDYIKPNETEAKILTGIHVEDQGSAEKAGKWFVDKGVGTAIITLGKMGTMVVSNDYSEYFPVRKVTAVDTTGAGDIFCGAFMTALADEKKIPEAIEFANHAAALSVTRFGVVESIPSIKEVKEFILKGVNKKNKKN
ncbi:MAG: ribokinase [Saprospiraceae bacterium]|jgi:ribokinase